jgi:hypothetical protein
MEDKTDRQVADNGHDDLAMHTYMHACMHARTPRLLCTVYSAERPCKAAAAESTQLIRWGSRTDWQYKMWTQFVNVNSLSSDNATREKETGGKASSETAKLESHQHGPRTLIGEFKYVYQIII